MSCDPECPVCDGVGVTEDGVRCRWPESLGGACARLRREARELGAVAVEVGLDQIEARLRNERNDRL